MSLFLIQESFYFVSPWLFKILREDKTQEEIMFYLSQFLRELGIRSVERLLIMVYTVNNGPESTDSCYETSGASLPSVLRCFIFKIQMSLNWPNIVRKSFKSTLFSCICNAYSFLVFFQVVLLVLEVHACIAKDPHHFHQLVVFLVHNFRVDNSLLERLVFLLVQLHCFFRYAFCLKNVLWC